jgi:hypothetical protein
MTDTSRKEWEFSRGQEYAEGAAKNDLLEPLLGMDSYFPEEQRRIAVYLRRNPKAVRTLADAAAIHEYEARAVRVAAAQAAVGGEVDKVPDDTPALREEGLIFAPKAFSGRTYPAFCEGYALRYVKDVFAGLKALTGNDKPEDEDEDAE